MKIDVPETRGRNHIYDFFTMELGETRKYDKDNSVILRCAQMQMKSRKLNWKFRTYTEGKQTIIIRVK